MSDGIQDLINDTNATPGIQDAGSYAAKSDTYDSSSIFSDFTKAAWDALAIYGQKRSIDAEFSNKAPAPQNTVTVKDDSGNKEAGQPFLFGASTRDTLLISGAILLIGTTVFFIAKN